MIESWLESDEGGSGAIRFFRRSVEAEAADLRFARIGTNFIVIGTVPSYAVKAFIDAQAESCGLAIWNCVRVVPGRDWDEPESLQPAS